MGGRLKRDKHPRLGAGRIREDQGGCLFMLDHTRIGCVVVFPTNGNVVFTSPLPQFACDGTQGQIIMRRIGRMRHMTCTIDHNQTLIQAQRIGLGMNGLASVDIDDGKS